MGIGKESRNLVPEDARVLEREATRRRFGRSEGGGGGGGDGEGLERDERRVFALLLP